MERPKMPFAQRAYGEVIYYLTILSAIICMIGPLVALLDIDNNIMNPHYVFAEIFAGKTAMETWDTVGGGFPGGHFYFQNFTAGDALTQFGMALGCFVAFPALLVAAVAYLKEKSIGYMLLCLWVAFMVAVSALGLVKGH